MKRIILALLLALGLSAPATAVELLPPLAITTATALTAGQVYQLRAGPGVGSTDLVFQANFTYGSGGTSVDAYVQTSLDGGGTWTDVAHFNFTTASLRTILSTTSTVATLATVSASDGGVGGTALAINTAVAGVFGNLWRVKYVTVGTYAATTLRIDAVGIGLTTLP